MPHIRWRAFAAAFAILLAAGSMQPGSAEAQGIFKRIKKQAKEKATERVVHRAGKGHRQGARRDPRNHRVRGHRLRVHPQPPRSRGRQVTVTEPKRPPR